MRPGSFELGPQGCQRIIHAVVPQIEVLLTSELVQRLIVPAQRFRAVRAIRSLWSYPSTARSLRWHP